MGNRCEKLEFALIVHVAQDSPQQAITCRIAQVALGYSGGIQQAIIQFIKVEEFNIEKDMAIGVLFGLR